ncbi:MAG: hypothetical protein ACE5J1_01590 [Nitrospiria bacterium]
MNPLSLNKVVLKLIPILLILSCQSGPEEKRQVDWSDVTLRASGVGMIEGAWSTSKRIRAIQRAKMDAYAKIESQIMKLRTDSRKHISDLAAKDEEIQKKISAFVRGAKIVGIENDKEGIKIHAELFLGENFEATIGLANRKPIPASSNRNQQGLPR